MRFLYLLTTIDRRIIYGLVFLATTLPFLFKKAPEVQITPEVEKVYHFIDKLPPGSRIVLSADYGPSSMPEIQPMLYGICKHAFSKGHKVYLLTHWNYQGLIAGQDGIMSAVQDFNREIREGKHPERTDTLIEGTDYVSWGFRPGGIAVMLLLNSDIRMAFSRDVRGQLLDSLPAMQGFRNLRDLGTVENPRGILIGLEAGFTGDVWVIYGQAQGRYPMALGSTAVVTPSYYTYLEAGQIIGILGGLKGAAEYEQLAGFRGQASIGMLSQSIVHILVVVLIFLGNLGFFLARRK
jgi:hypothetical protein